MKRPWVDPHHHQTKLFICPCVHLFYRIRNGNSRGKFIAINILEKMKGLNSMIIKEKKKD
jgi:hypothetical protein